MSDRSLSSNFPWAGAIVAVVFAIGTVMQQQVFDPLRPAEDERVQISQEAEFEVDARLWEDPFVAMRRFEAERVERCRKLGSDEARRTPTCAADLLDRRRDPALLVDALDRNRDRSAADTLVIAALVPGNPFVGAQESRRRIRYALLAGLQSKGYMPENAEHLGLLRFRLPPIGERDKANDALTIASLTQAHGFIGVRGPEFEAPYELLSERPALRDAQQSRPKCYSRIAVVWIDEATLPVHKLDSLAWVLNSLMRGFVKDGEPRLAVIGPSSSDALRMALNDLRRASDPKATLHDEVRAGYAQLARADILNASATAPNNVLEELNGQRLERFIAERLAMIGRGGAGGAPGNVNFRRTIATDTAVVRSLVRELQLRLSPDDERRVVLVAERDSLYSQALVSELQYQMRSVPNLKFEVDYFFRGVDGVTTRDGSKEPPKSDDKRKAADAVEWPERRDQLDYLRRLALALKDSEAEQDAPQRQGGANPRNGEGASAKGPIGAIGILASDVHDKLLVLQALRGSFPDKVFFTTDMDARYLHPRTSAFTRNLIVASSLPIALVEPGSSGAGALLRDVYQSATYLAARRAACRDDACRAAEDAWSESLLANPSVVEIGRSRAVPLAGSGGATRAAFSNVPRATVALAMLALLSCALLVWPSTAALRETRGWPGGGVDRSTALLVALHCALLAFTIGSAIEFVNPGRLSLDGMLIVAGLVAMVAVMLLHPRSFAAGASAAPHAARRGTARGPIAAALAAGAIAAVVLWLIWPVPGGACTDCEPAAWLEGVSAWPSHLIHLLALMATAWSLDQLWSDSRRSIRSDSAWLALPVARERRLGDGSRGLRSWLAQNALVQWQRRPGSVCFASLWRQYVHRGRGTARATRIAFWYVVTVAAAAALFFVFSDGYVPEVPVRGAEHRQLVAWTLYALLLLLPLLMVSVADATMLCCRFIWHLNAPRTRRLPGEAESRPDGERTIYPAETVERFARALGPDDLELWRRPIAAEPWQRGDGTPPATARHTLLDDWIDVQVVARRTQHVAPLIIGPFVVLALLVVARSRLFDNWALTLPVLLSICVYLLWLVLLAALLKQAAEQTRRRALARMNADLRWLAGSDRRPLVEPFRRLIGAVENERSGAFAPLLAQPLFKALLVPLGGAGGAQLFDALLLAR